VHDGAYTLAEDATSSAWAVAKTAAVPVVRPVPQTVPKPSEAATDRALFARDRLVAEALSVLEAIVEACSY